MGTHLAMAAAYTLASQAVLWTHTFGSPDKSPDSPDVWTAITPSTLFVQYGAATSGITRLAAVSVTTGEPLWDVAPGVGMTGLHQLVVGANGANVYVPLDSGIEIRDARTGQLVATVPR
jgi:hypothetical protein